MIVVKYFDGKPYIGKIASYRKPYYKVKYDDGDREEYTKEEVEKLLLIGKKVVNYFDGKPYHGVIKSYKYPYYKVLYEDGDEEDYDEEMFERRANGIKTTSFSAWKKQKEIMASLFKK